jgi:hypothetical protein
MTRDPMDALGWAVAAGIVGAAVAWLHGLARLIRS